MAGESLEGATIIHDVRTSRGAIAAIEAAGAKALMVPVGHAFAKPALRESGAICGGELAGHYYFRDFHCCDSGVLAALTVLGEVARAKREGRTFSEMMAPVCSVYANSGELNFKVEDKDAAVARMLAAAKRHFPEEISRSVIDGVRVEYVDGWFNVRKSNTEPYLRLIVECRTAGMLAEWTEILKNEI
jgi:phosphomannomutase